MNKYINYPGSLIQQNYGEQIFKGFNIIDLEKNSYEEVNLINKYAFVNVYIINKNYYVLLDNIGLKDLNYDIIINNKKYIKWKTFDEILIRLGIRNLRVRIIYSKLDRELIEIFKEKYLSNYEIEEFIEFFKADNIENILNDEIDNPKSENNGILQELNVSVIEKLIEKYSLEILKDIEEKEIKELVEINKEFNKGKAPIFFNPKKFRLIDLYFDNMFSYGEKNFIDFRQINGITGIFANNRMGKSSIIHIIIYMLFDKTPKIEKTIDILNNKKEKFYGKLRFLYENEIYVIEKTGEKNSKGTSVKVNIDFYKIVNDNKVNLNGEQRRETQKNIEQIVGNYDMFLLFHIYSSQFQSYNFLNLSQKDRRSLLTKIFGIEDYFYQLYDESRLEKNVLNKEIKKIDVDSILENIKKLSEENNEYELQIKNLKKIGVEKKKELNENENKKELLLKEIFELNKSIENLDEEKIENKLNQLEKTKVELNNKIKDKRGNVKVLEEKLVSLKAKLDRFGNISYYEEMISKYKILQQKVEAYKDELKTIKSKIDKYENYTAQVKLLKFDVSHCNYCASNYKILTKKNIEIEDKLIELKEQYLKVEKEKKIYENKLKEMDNIDDYYKKIVEYEKLKSELSDIKNKIEYIKKSIENDLLTLETIDYKINDEKNKLTLIRENKEKIKRNETINYQIHIIKEKISLLKNELDRITNDIYSLKAKIELNNHSIENYNKILETYKNNMERYRIITLYNQLVSPSGLPLKLINDLIKIIEKMVNNVINSITNFNIRMYPEKDKINIYILENNTVRGAKLSSGMESFVINIAFKVALMNISNYSKFSFIAIDEGWSALDRHNVIKSKDILNGLKGYYDNIFVISHIELLRDFVDNYITLTKDEYNFTKLLI